MRYRKAALWMLTCWFIVITLSCTRDGGSSTSYEPDIVADNVHVLDKLAIQNLVIDGNTYSFPSGAPGIRDIAEGDIIISREGAGFLRKVTSVYYTWDGRINLETEQASMAEVFVKGEFSHQVSISSDDLVELRPKGVSSKAMSPTQKGILLTLSNVTLYESNDGTKVYMPEGHIDLEPLVTHKARFDNGLTFLEVSASVKIDAGVTLTSQFNGVLAAEITLARYQKLFSFTGPGKIPIAGRLTLKVKVGFETTLSHAISGNAQGSLTMGIANQRETGWQNISGSALTFSSNSTLNTEGKIKVYVKPEVEIEFYSVPWAGLNCVPYFELAAWQRLSYWELAGGLDGKGFVEVEVFDSTFVTSKGKTKPLSSVTKKAGISGSTLIKWETTLFDLRYVLDSGSLEASLSPPSAPSGLTATAVSNSQIDLSWTDNSNDEDGFKLERKTGETGVYSQIATVGANVTSYSDTGLSPGTTYYYRVRAYNMGGDSSYSNEASATTQAEWQIFTIDSIGDVGSYSSIATDSNDKVHISYWDQTNYDLKYATNVSWYNFAVDTAGFVGQYTSIGIDSNNKLHISYYDYTNQDLKYATNVSGSWQSFTIDTAGDVGYYTSIAIDSNNKVHISYLDSTNVRLKYATNVTGSWQTFVIDRLWDCYSSIAIDSNNKVHISYCDTGMYDCYLKYATNASGSWQTFVIETGENYFKYPSIAIDSNNKVHISYIDSANYALKYATDVSGSWQIFTIESGGPDCSSIAIDSNNNVHISYYDWTNYDLTYATNISGTWQIFTIDSEGDVGWLTSIATDSRNMVHISYSDWDNKDLKYATNAPPISGEIPAAPSGLAAAAVASSQIDLSWTDNSDNEDGFKVQRKEGASGTWQDIATRTANTTSHQDTGLTPNTTYYYRVCAFNWAGNSSYSGEASAITPPPPETPPDAPSGLALVVVSSFQIDLSWTDNSDNEEGFKVQRKKGASGTWQDVATKTANTTSHQDTWLDASTTYYYRVYAYNSAGNSPYSNEALAITEAGWQIFTIDYKEDVGYGSSIAIDSADKVHICYYELLGDSELRYATDASGSWQISTIDSGLSRYPSIAIDFNDKLHISYLGWGDLKYATNASGSWQTFTIDSEGEVGYWTSIAIDSNDKVHISYCDWTNKDLRYATNASGSWQTFVIDSEGDVGRFSSIAIDSNNKVHISYRDQSNFSLKYATNVSGSWQTYTIDASANVGEYTSIAIDSNNKVHVSYYDYTNDDLKYATDVSGSWQIFTIDSLGTLGKYTSIAIDSNNKIHISYLDETNYDPDWAYDDPNLKYATNVTGSWQTFTVDSVEEVGFCTSIAVDSSDKIHISYAMIDTTLGANLKYATNK